MKKDFRLFDVYLGSQRRKEDIFTYYLAAMVEFLYENYKQVFNQLMERVFEISAPSASLFSGEQSAELIKESITAKFLKETERRVVFREVPIEVITGNAYLDVMFVLGDEKNRRFVAIEGKVYDRSVRPRQLKLYYNTLRKLIPPEISIDIILLSTIRETKTGEESNAAREVEAFREETSKSARLVLWSDIEKVIRENIANIDDGYFLSMFEDVFQQLKRNRQEDYEATEFKPAVELFGLADYLKDLPIVERLESILNRIKEDGIQIRKHETARMSAWILPINGLQEEKKREIFDWILELFTRAERNGTLQKWDKRYRVNTAYEDNLGSLSDSETVKSLSEIADRALQESLPRQIKLNLKMLKENLSDLKGRDVLQNLISEFLSNIESKDSRIFYDQLLIERNLAGNPYVQFVSDAAHDITNLGVHVRLSDTVKQRSISLLTLRPDEIWIPINK